MREVPAVAAFNSTSGTQLLQLNNSQIISSLLAFSVDNTRLLLVAYSYADEHFLDKVKSINYTCIVNVSQY